MIYIIKQNEMQYILIIDKKSPVTKAKSEGLINPQNSFLL